MSMSCGNATVVVVEHRHDAMHCDAFKGKLEAVLQMIDRGDLGGGLSYGGDEHKAALHVVERQIAATRARITELEAIDAAASGVALPAAMIEAKDARRLADELEKLRCDHWTHWTAQENHIAATAVRHLRLLAEHNSSGVALPRGGQPE